MGESKGLYIRINEELLSRFKEVIQKEHPRYRKVSSKIRFLMEEYIEDHDKAQRALERKLKKSIKK